MSTLQGDPFFFSQPAHITIPGAFPHSARITDASRKLTAELIAQDAHDHHVFFKRAGLHNHLIHIVLADYSLGADTQRLREIYKEKAPEQLPIQGKRGVSHDFAWNDPRCLGDQDYYQSYLAFFAEEVRKGGIAGTIERYIFGPEAEAADMLVRFVSGAYHPMIHTGYGVEFRIPMMVAEGLAQTAVHSPSAKPLFQRGTAELTKHTDQAEGTRETALEIAAHLQGDVRLDGLISFAESPKFGKLLEKSRACELVLEYRDKWQVVADSTEGLLASSGELMSLAAAIYAGPQRPEKRADLDFFIMHALTSSLFLPAFVHLLERGSAERLLRSKLAVDFAYYACRNRPRINIEQFSRTKCRSWDELFAAGVAHDDEHVPKVLRALRQTELYDRTAALRKQGGVNVYRSMAELTLEADGKWSFDGSGFDETWEKVPDRVAADTHPVL